MLQDNRKFDIIVWGATGFTGRLVVEYFVNNYPDIPIAIAGRNKRKCEDVLSDLALELPIVVADAFDEVSLRAMVQQTRVVCTTVGPYSTYGHLLVGLCVEEDTHYCDLTGEPPFVRAIIDNYHQIATKKGVRIVHACGFDSIPSDLGVLMTQKYIYEQTGEYSSKIRYVTGKMKGGFSGGTIASLVHMLDQLPENPELPKLLRNPYALNVDINFKGPDGADQMNIQYCSDLQRWTAPFVMAGTNTKMVRRTQSLMDFPYGKQFQYSEVMGFPKWFKGLMMALSTTFGLGIVLGSMTMSPFIRHKVWKMLPQPGEGPSAAERQAGYFNVHLFGEVNGQLFEGIVGDTLDPGYACTAKMLAESCLCLVLNHDQLSSDGGVLTPTAAFGLVLLERLKRAGMRFECRSL